MFEQSFKPIDDILRKDAGVANELDYVEQTSWILFLKYLDDLDEEKVKWAKLAGGKYEHFFLPKYRWATWAAPKTVDGKLDHNKSAHGRRLEKFCGSGAFSISQAL